MKWLEAVTSTPASAPASFGGLEAPAWTIITGIAAVLATLFSIVVAAYSLRRADRREHHRWLQEKRREAYVGFMTAARSAYAAIFDRGQFVNAPRVASDFPSHDETRATHQSRVDLNRRLETAMADIDRKMGELARAQDIVAIVGPEEMEKLGSQVIARLKLDRGFYSPTGWSDRKRPQERERILINAEDTGSKSFLDALRKAYAENPLDIDAFRAAFHNHRLEVFWDDFNDRARLILKESKPGQHR